MPESLFSRLQKLNKEATPPEWRVAYRPTEYVRDTEPVVVMKDNTGGWWDEDSTILSPENADLIVECRNSLPAVLNLIEAAQALRTARDGNLSDASFNISVDEVCEAVELFFEGLTE